MIIDEHLVARTKPLIDEINNMLNDFKKGNPLFNDCEWEEGGKNATFAKTFQDKTNRILTDKIIKNEIISDLTYKMFIDVIYPYKCDEEKDPIKKRQLCLDAIKGGHLFWVFNMKSYETYDSHGNDINMGELYIKLEPISGEFYIVKSLHTPDYLSCDGDFTKKDESMIHLYDEYISGKIR